MPISIHFFQAGYQGQPALEMRIKMDKLIDLNTYQVSENLKALLKDKTTKKNIIFATLVYSFKGTPIKEKEQMMEEILKGFTQYEIQPRVLKNKEQQQERTRSKAYEGRQMR